MNSFASATIFALSMLFFLTSAATAEDYQIYLIGGQSNANGRGDASQLPPELAQPQTGVRFYWHRSQKTTNVGWLPEDQWTDLVPGSGHGVTKPVYAKEFGPELSFGQALATAYPHQRIAIVKYSHGGSNLHKAWSESGPIYKTFVSTTKAAIAALTEAGHTVHLRGMIWQQGEADTAMQHAKNYEANLTRLIARVRTDLFAGRNLPFVIGGLSNSQDPNVNEPTTGFGLVRAAQEAVAKSVPMVGFVNTDGFPTRIGEAIHFNHEGQLALGKAHAAEILRLGSKASSQVSRKE